MYNYACSAEVPWAHLDDAHCISDVHRYVICGTIRHPAFSLITVFVYSSDKELKSVMCAVLAIPLVSELPTPNARKTCALAIWVIQMQRLPAEVLFPSKDRIAYALRRAIEGELGKEGKKGSINDGLKVCR